MPVSAWKSFQAGQDSMEEEFLRSFLHFCIHSSSLDVLDELTIFPIQIIATISACRVLLVIFVPQVFDN